MTHGDAPGDKAEELPFAGITRIRFDGSAQLPQRPLSLVPRNDGTGWLPE